MIIYSTTITFESSTTIPSLVESIAYWFRKKIHVGVELEDLLRTETRYHGRHMVELVCNGNMRQEDIGSWAMRYTHPDDKVVGRQWSTEVGMLVEEGLIRVSVLLSTSEISSRVPAAIEASRPWFVNEMLNNSIPIPTTPGLFVHRIGQETFPDLRRRIESRDRRHPILIVSAAKDGNYLVDDEFLLLQVATLADVYVLPRGVDHHDSSRLLGQFYNTWDGAVKIVWPYHRNVADYVPANTRWFSAEDIAEIKNAGEKPERRILQTLTHGTNLPHMRKHITPEHVREIALRRQLEEYGKNTLESDFLLTYIEEIERNAKRAIQDLNDQIGILTEQKEDLDTALFVEREAKRHLQTRLEQAQLSRNRRLDTKEALAPLRAALSKAWNRDLLLTDVLDIISNLFPDRVVVLDSACKSARDAVQFGQAEEVLQLLWKLATDYWEALNSGQGDNVARAIFGSSYAAKESDTVRNTSRLVQYRTFTYQSQPIVMLSHLKLGVKDSVAQTWRAHFAWHAKDRVIVLGHCGKHLPLS
ncbi:hypothetical protein F8S13_19525 [Chloroflexia bacterium SDU3-3]|nr:hypothetical protein F8S13_19525 [Chloroflexia bacterium SDU3-3]